MNELSGANVSKGREEEDPHTTVWVMIDYARSIKTIHRRLLGFISHITPNGGLCQLTPTEGRLPSSTMWRSWRFTVSKVGRECLQRSQPVRPALHTWRKAEVRCESHRSVGGGGAWGSGGEWSTRLVPGLGAGRALVEGSRRGAKQRCGRSTPPATLPSSRAQKQAELGMATGQMAAAGDVQTSWEPDTSEKRGEAWWEHKEEETSAQGCSDVPGGLTTSFS